MATKRKPTKRTKADSGTTGSVAKKPAAPSAPTTEEDASSQSASDRRRREPSASTADGSTGSDADAKAPRKRAGGKRRWVLRALLLLVALALVAVAAFSWDRWLRYDDARELQGEWQVDGTTRIVVVDGASIKLTDDVSYSYVIDPAAKTISFSFGNMEGSGRYRFSADRSRLVIVEGGSYSLWSTLVEDVAWMWDGLVRSVQGLPPAEPEAGDGTTVFARVSHDAAAQPRDDASLAAPAPAEEPEPSAETGAEGAAGAPDAAGSEPSADGGDATNPGDAPDAASSPDAAQSPGANPGSDSSDADAAGTPDAAPAPAPDAAPGSLFDVSDR